METFIGGPRPPQPQQPTELLGLCHVFSPNAEEAASLVGPGPPAQLAARLLRAGAQA